MALRLRHRSRQSASLIEGTENQASPKPTRNIRARFARDLGFLDASRLPKKLFRWLYSISLIIFMLLTFGFILVTPLDIIVQTWGAPSTWIKTFIVIMACALFLLFCLIIYFSRLYQSRMMLNQIPSKSVYIPLEKNDLPSDVRQYIEGTLRRCIGDIKVRAGPLHNENEILNFPGASPPEYIQKRNISLGFPKEGTNLPPDCLYEEILDSLGLQIRLYGMSLTRFDIPEWYSFREIAISMTKILVEERELDSTKLQDVKQMVRLYEKLKYGPELIKELEIVRFLALFDKLSLAFHTNRLQFHESEEELSNPWVTPQRIQTNSRGSSFGGDNTLMPTLGVPSQRKPANGARSSRSVTRSDLFEYIDRSDVVLNRDDRSSRRISRMSTHTSDPLGRPRGSMSSSKSVIKSKLMFPSRAKERPKSASEIYYQEHSNSSQQSSDESGDTASVKRFSATPLGSDQE
uniref:Defect at low temperature protein 1 n=1 Tax=Candidozyma auris TaxID=498019 RepID=A0A0L0P528_CANAR